MRLLDDATLNRVYVDLVRPLLFEDLSASAAPELIMVGGQRLLLMAGNRGIRCEREGQAANFVGEKPTFSSLMLVAR
jgi:hypothetical protein